jgi:hypothetical protein
MEVHLSNPELQAKIDRWVSETGRPADELVEDAMAGYFGELVQVRELLDSRYDDIKGGKVQLMDGEVAFARLKEKTEAQRNRIA